MQHFFDEAQSKKLIKRYQVLFTVFIGYLELNQFAMYTNQKVWNTTKNAIDNLHRNYLVFIEFILANLTKEQNLMAKSCVQALRKVLEMRTVMKTHYSLFNSKLLDNNNILSMNLIKDLLASCPKENKFKKEAKYVLNNLDSLPILLVKKRVKTSIGNYKSQLAKSSLASCKSFSSIKNSLSKTQEKSHKAISKINNKISKADFYEIGRPRIKVKDYMDSQSSCLTSSPLKSAYSEFIERVNNGVQIKGSVLFDHCDYKNSTANLPIRALHNLKTDIGRSLCDDDVVHHDDSEEDAISFISEKSVPIVPKPVYPIQVSLTL